MRSGFVLCVASVAAACSSQAPQTLPVPSGSTALAERAVRRDIPIGPQMRRAFAGGIVGDSAVGRALAQYAVSWKYKHPSPWDFFFSMNRSLGKDLGWFWHAWFFTNYTFDQSIESVTRSGNETELSIRDKGDMAMPVIARVDYSDGTFAILTLPVDSWFGGSRSLKLRHPSGGKTATKVTLDSENRFQDLSRGDNVWPRQ